MDDRIKAFLTAQHLLTVSAVDCVDAIHCGVYSASCYYVFCSAQLSLCFKSVPSAKHIQLASINPDVGVVIAQDGALKFLKGVQIKAVFRDSTQEEQQLYYKKFPFAKLGSGKIFSLGIYFAKYTDNQLFLQKKITYTKE